MGKPTIPRNRIPDKHIHSRATSKDATRRAHEDQLDREYTSLMRTYLATLPPAHRERLALRIYNIVEPLAFKNCNPATPK